MARAIRLLIYRVSGLPVKCWECQEALSDFRSRPRAVCAGDLGLLSFHQGSTAGRLGGRCRP